MENPARPGAARRLARLVRFPFVLLRHVLAASAASLGALLLGRRDRVGEPWRTRAPRALADLGAAYVKVGQLLATRRDLLPPRWCAELGRLHDEVPPPRPGSARRVLEAAYRCRRWPFAEIEVDPIACGSIATVYRATLHDGRRVAVKVRRTAAVATLAADLSLLRSGARLAAKLPAFREMPVLEIVDQLNAAVTGQLDFAAELDSLRRLRRNLAHLRFIRLPGPVEELCGPDVIVMDLVDGLTRFGPERLTAETSRRVVTNALTAVYTMLFRDGFVHCDLHPGNLYLTTRGEVVILDAGFTVHLGDRVRRLFAEYFLNMAAGNGERCAELVIESAAAVAPGADLAGFRAAMAVLVHEVTGVPAAEFDLGQFAVRLFDLQRRKGIFAAAEFVFPLLSLLTLEGMVREFAADVDFQLVAVPILLEALEQDAQEPPLAG